MQSELLPCPLCGGDELSHGYVAAGGIEWGTAGCEACDLQVTKGTEAEAIAAWNTRAPTEDRGKVAKLVKATAGLCNAYELLCGDAGKHYHHSPSSYYARARQALAEWENTQ